MSTFVVAHGAWSAGWAWKKMHPRFRDAGHALWTPSYTGLGERGHLATPKIDLETHIEDVLGVLAFENLADVVLVAHSYGGMVATAVADRARDRIAQLIYLDAFVPEDGQSLFDLSPPEGRARMEALARGEGQGWRVPPNPIPPDTGRAETAWITQRRQPQPIETFRAPLRLSGGPLRLPRSYIYCLRSAPGDVFAPFAARAKSDPGWRYFEIDASHSPHVTAPDALCALILRIAADDRR